jgi:hypothetical protein
MSLQAAAELEGRVAAILVLLIVLMTIGCTSESFSGDPVENQPPEVWLSAAPPEGTSNTYIVHMYWGGWDPDGEIAYYEYSITDNEFGAFDPEDTTGSEHWSRVYSNDSTFTFTADQPADSNASSLISKFQRSHTFFIRAVDMLGMPSTEPDYRSFTTWTLSPSVNIQIPVRRQYNPANVPAITTYRWEAFDYINTTQQKQEPDAVRWILHPAAGGNFQDAIEWVRNNVDSPEWSDWADYRAPGDSGKFWTTPPTSFGNYVFAIQAKDEAGAVTPVFDERYNVRRILVSRRTTGPQLTVTNQFVGSIVTAVATTPITIVDLPAGVPVQFRWSATAEEYGGTVIGYRYGWDIADLTDPDQWDVDWTPFSTTSAVSLPKEYYFGVHTFTIEVIDNSGSVSRIEVKINIVQFTMERNLLLVDDYLENPEFSGFSVTGGAVPSDEEHDAFWAEMLDDLDNFNSVSDIIEVRGGDIFPISVLAHFKSVIWNVTGGYALTAQATPMMAALVSFRSKDPTKSVSGGGGKVQPNIISLFMAAGGHVLVCGEQPLSLVINTSYFKKPVKFPILLKFELEGNQTGRYADQIGDNRFVGDESFAYLDACVGHLDISYPNYNNLRRHVENGCGVYTKRNIDLIGDGFREAIPIDPEFPRLTLRPESAGQGKFYAPDSRGLNAELYNAPYFDFCGYVDSPRLRGCFEPIYGNGCLNTSSVIYGAPVASWTSTYAHIFPDVVEGSVAARSAFFGFEPVFFNPDQVRPAIEYILYDEWQLPRK